jgi:hypothetical protein
MGWYVLGRVWAGLGWFFHGLGWLGYLHSFAGLDLCGLVWVRRDVYRLGGTCPDMGFAGMVGPVL